MRCAARSQPFADCGGPLGCWAQRVFRERDGPLGRDIFRPFRFVRRSRLLRGLAVIRQRKILVMVGDLLVAALLHKMQL